MLAGTVFRRIIEIVKNLKTQSAGENIALDASLVILLVKDHANVVSKLNTA